MSYIVPEFVKISRSLTRPGNHKLFDIEHMFMVRRMISMNKSPVFTGMVNRFANSLYFGEEVNMQHLTVICSHGTSLYSYIKKNKDKKPNPPANELKFNEFIKAVADTNDISQREVKQYLELESELKNL